MKKTCNGCKAFWRDMYACGCELGYEIKITNTQVTGGLIQVSFHPAEECPKPKTKNELAKSRKKEED